MLTNEQASQLDQYEKSLDEDYRNKKEAIAFTRNFLAGVLLPTLNGNNTFNFQEVLSRPPEEVARRNGDQTLPPLDIDDGPSLYAKVAAVMEQYQTERWTMRRMLAYLQQSGFPIKSSKPEAAISAAMSKLYKLRRIIAIRQGAGKTQGIYQWNASYIPPTKDDTILDESSIGEEQEEISN